MLLLMVLQSNQKQLTQDIVLSATGFINVGDLQIDDANNRIINTSTNPFLLSFTNNVPTQYGHVAFTDTSGIVIPSGSLASRPGNPTVGTTRYNNTLRYLETWYDNAWNNVTEQVILLLRII